ncbi:MAG TPA: hypothetical protein ENN22_10300 [bacterium]|nr:hypothetical protein [bacterium]
MIKHTFLLEEGIWRAEGIYRGADQKAISSEGEAKITHHAFLWINEGVMRMQLEKPIEIHNRYEIVPLAPARDFTSFIAINPTSGKLFGKLMLVDDTILSSFVSESGEYSGTEVLIKINDELYNNRGFSFYKNTKLSSWSMTLSRA